MKIFVPGRSPVARSRVRLGMHTIWDHWPERWPSGSHVSRLSLPVPRPFPKSPVDDLSHHAVDPTDPPSTQSRNPRRRRLTSAASRGSPRTATDGLQERSGRRCYIDPDPPQ
ncbi:hypothetical protein RHA1_ro00634 [Rhodococcus jostii RHA1]|uniref:Uncharacterized protein n=1 Tax=Rhodococcus jostii (strain RHA1) TaxID=101510 RepID=Q0SJ17_RHOJR|nr:hypothetical protein RHA1_ro00634 [Rhodococcus jostii RHA1]